MQDTIVVFSGSSTLSGLIARTLRLQQVYCRPVSWDTCASQVLALSPKGMIWAAEQNLGADLQLPDMELLDLGIPILALGSAVPALCQHFGGARGELLDDSRTVTLGLANSPLLSGISGGERMLHGLESLTLPETLVSLATATERCIGFQHANLPVYAMEYPIEHNDPDGARMLNNFATLVCGADADWDEDAIIRRAVAAIREAAGDGGVLCAVSGGVDSAVCARLAQLAVGDQLECLFVDTGLLRRGEAQEMRAAMKEAMGLEIREVDAREAFQSALAGVWKARDKERITSTLLGQLFVKQLSGEGKPRLLVTGTNFNDTLYGTGTQMGRQAGATEEMRMIEPIRDLFKEEVRRLAVALALPTAICERQCFPASGLALRIFGEVTPQRLSLLRAADAVFVEEIRKGGHEKRLWQYYATLLEAPEDASHYVVVLRASQAGQGGAYAARLPYDLLEGVVERIRRELGSVSRVVYDLTPSAHYTELE